MGNGVGVVNDKILKISIGQADLERAGLYNLMEVFHRRSMDQHGMITIGQCVNYLSKQLDVFITHDWGSDGSNHNLVSRINDALKTYNLKTWFDNEELYGDIKESVTEGIDNSRVILVCVTKRYNAKITGSDKDDHCKIEFEYASHHKDQKKIIAVLLEPDIDDEETGEPLRRTLRQSSVINFSDSSNFDVQVKELYQKIMGALGGPDTNLAMLLERVDLNTLIGNRDQKADVKFDPADELIRQEMVEWMRVSLKYPRKLADKYVIKLINEGVGSEEQLLKKLQRSPNFLVQLGFDESDAEDIQDSLFMSIASNLTGGTSGGAGVLRKSLKSIVTELSDTVTTLRAEVAGLEEKLKIANTGIHDVQVSTHHLQVQSGKHITAISHFQSQLEIDSAAISRMQRQQEVDSETISSLRTNLIDNKADISRLVTKINRDEEEITLIKAEAAKEAAFSRAMELEVSKNNSLLAELQAEIKHDEDVIRAIQDDATASLVRIMDLESRVSQNYTRIEDLQMHIDEDRLKLKSLSDKAAATVSSIARLETNAKEDRANITRLDRCTEDAKVWDLLRAWSSPPCAESRSILADQLRKQKLVDGEVWTPEYITWEVQNDLFADSSKAFRINSPKKELVEGVQGCISVERAAPEGDIQCFIWLYGFRGFAEFAITMFRFGKGAPKQKSGRFTWEKDEGKGWVSFIPQGKFSAGEFLSDDGKLRFLASFVFKR